MTTRPIRVRTIVGIWLVFFFPWLPGWPLWDVLPKIPSAFVIYANQAGVYALIAFSLVLLTGWVGQISLGQGAFVGLGAFLTGIFAGRWHVPFPLDLPLAAGATAAVAAALGAVALRVRGLYLAVATLIFAWMCDAFLFSSTWLVGQAGASSIPAETIGRPGTITYFDLSSTDVMYLITVALVAGAWYLAVNLRDSKTGRAFFAVRGSETAAVSLGIDVSRYKLLAFAISGGLAGLAGNLFMTTLRTATPVQFQFTQSLFYLGIAVVGGVTSLGGGLGAAVLFSALSWAFSQFSFLNGWLDIVTIGLLLGVLLGYPGGLAGLGQVTRVRLRALHASGRIPAIRPVFPLLVNRLLPVKKAADDPPASAVEGGPPAHGAQPGSRSAREILAAERARAPRQPGAFSWRDLAALLPERLQPTRVTRRTIDFSDLAPVASPLTVHEIERFAATVEPAWRSASPGGRRNGPADRDQLPIVLEASNVTVRFGGLTAVDDVSLSVRKGEIVGLIGPNGAGKTTTFNAIAGLNRPTAGTVRLFGQDVTDMPVHLRAQMGVGRTFQLIQLFPQLTVFENLLVATHVDNPSSWVANVLLTGPAVLAERAAREQVTFVTGLLGLEEYADRKVAGLPFGILRNVEIARALVTRPPLLMLDEPASGLDNSETEELAKLLCYLRDDVGVSILLIEHDVHLVTTVSDYMHVINRGRPLAYGTPAEVQRNPEVVAAYLGQAAEGDRQPQQAGEPVEVEPV